MTEELLVDRRGSVVWVTFNRPQARNALTKAMYDRLVDVCGMVDEDRAIRAMVITGAGQAFAAGTDINHFTAFDSDASAIEYETHGDHVMRTLERARVPVVAAIAGPCTGGGAAIASCCDLRIGAPSARFGIPIARTLGNCLSQQSYARVVALLGLARAKDLLLTARLLNADEMLSTGVITELVPEVRLLERAEELAELVAANAPLTQQVTKQALLRVRDRLVPDGDGADLYLTCYRSRDFREGVAAFLGKRRPVWSGE